MPFIPHTKEDIQSMLQSLGVRSIQDLFDEIPASLKIKDFSLSEGMNEMALRRLMQERSEKDQYRLNFIGAGAYEHHIPALVWDIVSRGEWMTAYTPYQAEASQGTLQLLYEYQTMMANLMAMEVSNASLYEGGSALAEAILMAARLSIKTKSSIKRILLPTTVHPLYRQVVKTLVQADHIEILELPYDEHSGAISLAALEPFEKQDSAITALVIPQPNFFGILEDVDGLTKWASQNDILTIGVVNPLAMALLKPPGLWASGVDIACGEGQPLGVPLASGGPYFGFLCCKKEHIRQLPGRLIGRTEDNTGKEGFTLTLQAREQHIRRAKATSNICTNQGLLVTAATLYMSLLGPEGLYQVARESHHNARILRDQLLTIDGVSCPFSGPFFHEIVIRLDKSLKPVEEIIQTLALQGIQAGFNLKAHYEALGECLLICTTETKTEEDLKTFSKALQKVLKKEVSVC